MMFVNGRGKYEKNRRSDLYKKLNFSHHSRTAWERYVTMIANGNFSFRLGVPAVRPIIAFRG